MSGWHGYKDKCYFLSTVKADWLTADDDCQNLGAQLASIHDTDEMDFLYGIVYVSFISVLPIAIVWFVGVCICVTVRLCVCVCVCVHVCEYMFMFAAERVFVCMRLRASV